ncbi:MAG TPA: HAD-IA family hydrolase [Rhodanobacteraceae bacterium]|nr:HAD-IA family hydrolase [Rhodanobacteraceae bacterium]
MSSGEPVRAVLFDLDGTLVDSAPDLIAAVTRLCAEIGAPPPMAETVRRSVSAGGRAMLRRALPGADDERIDTLLPRFLELYSRGIAVHTRLYPDIGRVLGLLHDHAIPWGVVTNKPGWLARSLLQELDLATRCAALVCGDCLPVRKPDPLPVLRACELAGANPGATTFVGDDLRDIEAGRAAGTRTIAAAWGYLDGGDPATWGADRLVARPIDLVDALGLD